MKCNKFLLQISSQQQVFSWSTQEKLSNKVIYDNNSNQYIGIFGNRFIRCWNGFTTDINSVKKIKLQKSAVAIVPTETGAIILYADGDWDKLSEALTPRKDFSSVSTVLDATHLNYGSVKDVNVKSLFNDTQVLIYFVQAEDNKKIHLVVLPLKVGGQQIILKITRKDMTVDLSGYAIVEGDNNFMLLTIWSDQRMFLLNLDENVESEKSPGNFVSIISTLKVDTPLSILGIAKNCVAIYGANSNQEGASLILYNTQFKVAKAQQFFKVFFDCSRIWSIDENIIIAMGQNLSVVTYRMSQELLIDLLGTYSGENNTRIEGDHINEEDYHQSFCSFKESSCIFRKKAVNFKCDSTGKDLKGHLKILEKLRDYSCLGEENQTFVKVDHEKSFLDDIIAVVETPLDTQLINRTLFELFARQYENCGATGQEMSEKLLVLLSKLECSSENMSLLSRFSSAPESILAKVFFSMVIKSDPKTLKYKYFARNMLTSCGTGTFRKTELTEQFRSDFSSFGLLFLLDYFYELLTEPSPMEPFCTETSYLKFEMQIIRWLDGLLNAYFQHLVLSKEVRVIKTLSKWTILILAYSNQIRKLEELLSLLYNLVQKEQLTESSNASMWYCIEDLSF
ncbi:uncharacterized protein LOC118749202 [Rhagoletis pomonella]|uniref:uncharacterized protein LOC118749202 n=1 Tax=Rhagoletis pomonella TaxID=28610 RepID=UPI00177F6C4F|nr:uncharacterized protein LOC118749202 [Rhagoletis pomonella]